MARLNAYITFNGNCREAMTFYQESLGGKLDLSVVRDSPAAEHMAPEMQDFILHADLSSDNFTLFASDMFDVNAEQVVGNVVSLCYSGTKDEVTAAFNKMAAGGTITEPLRDEFFGMFGKITDKFSINWMFEADKEA